MGFSNLSTPWVFIFPAKQELEPKELGQLSLLCQDTLPSLFTSILTLNQYNTIQYDFIPDMSDIFKKFSNCSQVDTMLFWNTNWKFLIMQSSVLVKLKGFHSNCAFNKKGEKIGAMSDFKFMNCLIEWVICTSQVFSIHRLSSSMRREEIFRIIHSLKTVMDENRGWGGHSISCRACKLIFASERGALQTEIVKFGAWELKFWKKVRLWRLKFPNFSQKGCVNWFLSSFAWNGTLANYRRGVKSMSSGLHIPMPPF